MTRRVVRVKLIHHLKDHYDVREESDGEAAWRTLVVDHSIKAVISDLQMPKLNGYELLELVRSSKLRRLRRLPFIMVSGENRGRRRPKAMAMGVSISSPKGLAAQLLARLNNLLSPCPGKPGRTNRGFVWFRIRWWVVFPEIP